MSTVTNVQHFYTTAGWQIKTKVKAFQKPKRDIRSNNKKVRG